MGQRILLSISFLFLLNCASVPFNTTDEEIKINNFLNEWHNAAATADEDLFFNSFTKDGIYIGTDPTEHWTAPELKEWSKEYFKRKSAWAFKPLSRNIFFSENHTIAWFDELLQTQMGICRSSGVLVKINNTWKIKHYHLSVAIDNDKMEDYLKIIHK